VIMSNCVINLAPDKGAVFREAFRVLAPGGRLAISDIVAIGDMPAALANDPAAYTGCVAGAAPVADIERALVAAGFSDVRITLRGDSAGLVQTWSPGAEHVVASALIEGVKRSAGADPCCDTVLLDTCCEPADKPGCCGVSHDAATCGCQTSR